MCENILQKITFLFTNNFYVNSNFLCEVLEWISHARLGHLKYIVLL